MNKKWQIDAELLKVVDESIQGMARGQSTLPVPAPLFYVINGNGISNQESPALQYGGWACDKEAMDAIIKETGRFLPYGLAETHSATKSGTVLTTYTTRSLMIAPVALRSSWVDRESGFRSPKYVEGSRKHVQMLTILGARETQNDKVKVWGPAILSAKGCQAKKLAESPTAWKKHLFPMISSVADGQLDLAASLFWMPIGTFGKEYNAELVGTSKAQSSITPLRLFLPKIENEDDLEKLFGGEQLAEAITDLYESAEVWRMAWRDSLQEIVDPQTGRVLLQKPGMDSKTEEDRVFPF